MPVSPSYHRDTRSKGDSSPLASPPARTDSDPSLNPASTFGFM
jgi:hypothetical protein